MRAFAEMQLSKWLVATRQLLSCISIFPLYQDTLSAISKFKTKMSLEGGMGFVVVGDLVTFA